MTQDAFSGRRPGRLPSPAQRAGATAITIREGQRPGHLRHSTGLRLTNGTFGYEPLRKRPGRWPSWHLGHRIPSPVGWAKQMSGPLARRVSETSRNRFRAGRTQDPFLGPKAQPFAQPSPTGWVNGHYNPRGPTAGPFATKHGIEIDERYVWVRATAQTAGPLALLGTGAPNTQPGGLG